jgi:hypothetical protein
MLIFYSAKCQNVWVGERNVLFGYALLAIALELTVWFTYNLIVSDWII